MTSEIPENTAHTVKHDVSEDGLFKFFEMLHKMDDIIKIEHERAGANYKVTIHFAVMNLSLHRQDIVHSIGEAVTMANGDDHHRS